MKPASKLACHFGLLAAIAGLALVTACSDTATTEPTRPTATTRTSNDGDQPNSDCRSGWVVVDGVWTCPGG